MPHVRTPSQLRDACVIAWSIKIRRNRQRWNTRDYAAIARRPDDEDSLLSRTTSGLRKHFTSAQLLPTRTAPRRDLSAAYRESADPLARLSPSEAGISRDGDRRRTCSPATSSGAFSANMAKLQSCSSTPDSTLAPYRLLLFIAPASPKKNWGARRAHKSMEEGNGRRSYRLDGSSFVGGLWNIAYWD